MLALKTPVLNLKKRIESLDDELLEIHRDISGRNLKKRIESLSPSFISRFLSSITSM